MVSIDRISNGNEKISRREFNYLKKLANNPEKLKNIIKLNPRNIRKLKNRLNRQLEKYLNRKDRTESQKRLIKRLTDKALNNIDKYVGGKERKDSNIDSFTRSEINTLKSLLKNPHIRKKVERKVRLAYKNHKNSVRLKFSGSFHDVNINTVAGLLDEKTHNLNNKENKKYKNINIKQIEKDYESYAKNYKAIGMLKEYRRNYIKEIKRVEHYGLPKGSKEVIKKYSHINLNTVLEDSDVQRLSKESKALIKKHWNSIKKLMMGGVIRALKNVKHYKKYNFNAKNIPILINVPLTKIKTKRIENKKGKKVKTIEKFINASLSFIYNPKTKKIETEVFSYGFRLRKGKIWSNEKGSNASSLGTTIVNLKESDYSPGKHYKYRNNEGKLVGSKHNFYAHQRGIDKTNSNIYNRYVWIHGVSKKRSNLIKKGNTSSPLIASYGCIIYPDSTVGQILNKNKRKRYAIQETTYPVI